LNQRLLLALYRRLPRRLSALAVRALKPTYPIGVVAVVFNARGQVLVLKHTYHNPVWRLPGGLMDYRESPEETAVREVREEANCSVRPIGVVGASVLAFTFDVAVVCGLVEQRPFVVNAEVVDATWWDVSTCDALSDVQRAFVARAYEEWRRQA